MLMAKNEIHGWLVIDKPAGISSNKVLTEIKKILHPKKIGHAGTLDPFATGILLVALGEATKTVEYAMGNSKAYEFEITWGENRDTLDIDGQVIETSNAKPTQHDLEQALKSFSGIISQIPPAFSALKVNGERAYKLARAGEVFELKARDVLIKSLELVKYNESSAMLRVECGKGFYVRSLARDICEKLGVCGYVSSLRRTESAGFKSSDMILLDYLEKVVHNADSLDLTGVIKPVHAVLDDILVQQVTSEEAASLKQGRAITTKLEGSVVSAMFNNKVLALCYVDQGYLYPKRVFNY